MKRARRAWLHCISSELVTPDHCLRSAASLSDSPCHKRFSALPMPRAATPPRACATHSSAYRARHARAPTLLLRPPSVRTLLLPTEPAPLGLARPRREPLARLPVRPPLHLRALADATATPSLAPCVRAQAEPPHIALAHALLRVARAYCLTRAPPACLRSPQHPRAWPCASRGLRFLLPLALPPGPRSRPACHAVRHSARLLPRTAWPRHSVRLPRAWAHSPARRATAWAPPRQRCVTLAPSRSLLGPPAARALAPAEPPPCACHALPAARTAPPAASCRATSSRARLGRLAQRLRSLWRCRLTRCRVEKRKRGREKEHCLVEKEERRRQGTDKAEGEEKQRRKGIRTSQGLKRKIRKLQGLVCKANFPIDLKPK
jgi:hypothetical protein